MARFLLIYKRLIIEKAFVMGHSCHTKKKKKTKSAFYFFAITAVTAAACVFIIIEGQRIKKENELLSYEVW